MYLSTVQWDTPLFTGAFTLDRQESAFQSMALCTKYTKMYFTELKSEHKIDWLQNSPVVKLKRQNKTNPSPAKQKTYYFFSSFF